MCYNAPGSPRTSAATLCYKLYQEEKYIFFDNFKMVSNNNFIKFIRVAFFENSTSLCKLSSIQINIYVLVCYGNNEGTQKRILMGLSGLRKHQKHQTVVVGLWRRKDELYVFLPCKCEERTNCFVKMSNCSECILN